MRALQRRIAWIVALAAVALVQPATASAQQADAEPAPRQIEVEILGMSCPFCAYGVEQKLKRLEGVEKLDVELKTGIATLTLAQEADISNELLEKKVGEAGFETAAIRRNFESEYPDLEEDDGGGSHSPTTHSRSGSSA